MSEITITIPYWLPSLEQMTAFLAWWLPVGAMTFAGSFFATMFNRRSGCAPVLARASAPMGLAITALAIILWPIPLFLYARQIAKNGRAGR